MIVVDAWVMIRLIVVANTVTAIVSFICLLLSVNTSVCHSLTAVTWTSYQPSLPSIKPYYQQLLNNYSPISQTYHYTMMSYYPYKWIVSSISWWMIIVWRIIWWIVALFISQLLVVFILVAFIKHIAYCYCYSFVLIMLMAYLIDHLWYCIYCHHHYHYYI